MELLLVRTYFKEGTNGALFANEIFLCFTIELPWIKNQRNISCIPEGNYELTIRTSLKFGVHLYVKNVPNRSLILIHGGNDAKKDLEGCIAPVTTLSGIGKGLQSQMSLQKLVSKVSQAKERKEKVILTIKKSDYDFKG